MSRVPRSVRGPRRARWLGVALTIAALGLGACGSDEGDPGDTTAAPPTDSQSATATAAAGQPILILTRMTLNPDNEVVAKGAIRDGSTIGDSPFCPGGTVKDKHGTPDPNVEPFGLVDRTITCEDGTLRMGFTPGVPQGRTQAGPWKIVRGTGAFEGLQGNGQMEMKYDRGDDAKGRETFTGTVTQ